MEIFKLNIPFYRTELSDDWDNGHFAERFSKFVGERRAGIFVNNCAVRIF